MFQSINSSSISSLLKLNFTNQQTNTDNVQINSNKLSLDNSKIRKRFEEHWKQIHDTNLTNNEKCKILNELIIITHQKQYKQSVMIDETINTLTGIPEIMSNIGSLKERIENIKLQMNNIDKVIDAIHMQQTQIKLHDWHQDRLKELEQFKIEAKNKHQEQIDLFSQQMLKEYQVRMEQGNLFPLISKLNTSEEIEEEQKQSILELDTSGLEEFLSFEEENEIVLNNHTDSNTQTSHPLVAMEEDYPDSS